MDERSFPPVSVSASVLSEHERLAIGSPQARHARANDERRSYLAATASAGQRWLLRPRVASGQLAHASSWWTEERVADNHLSVDSFDGELAQPTGAAGSIEERDLRDLHAWPRAALKAHPLVESLPVLARGIECVSARASDSFSEWDGHVGANPALSTENGVLSATALETWATCPAKYFFKQVLRLREHDEPGDVEELEARYRGNLVHRILERLGATHLTRSGEQLELDLENVPSWTATAREVVTRVSEEVFDEFAAEGRAPYPILWEVEKARIVRDVLRTIDEDDGAVLLAVEHRFGDDDHPFTLELASGRKLQFTGSVDRVDRLHDRRRVLDYKTGRREPRKEVLTALARGTRLQLPLYALAAREAFGPPSRVDADYWFISTRGGWERVNIPMDERTRADFESSLEAIASGIERGVFAANPGGEGYPTFDNCGFCDFQRICPPDRDRAWDRLQDASELKDYLELSSRDAAEEPADDE
jgi:RecB family exonuclease